MHGAPDIGRARTITGEVRRLQNSRRNDRSEEFTIPAAMIMPRDRTGILVGEDLTDTVFDELERLPVATGRESVMMFPVALDRFRFPVAEADALDQVGADLVAFDGQRIIGVGDVDLIDVTEVSLRICRYVGRFGEGLENVLAHMRPGYPQPV